MANMLTYTSGFKNTLCREDITDKIFRLTKPLNYYSNMLQCEIEIPIGFQSDGASVPRLPLIYDMWGNRTHREALLHDAAYRIDFVPKITFDIANKLFLEAMESRDVCGYIKYPMYLAVCLWGKQFFHTMKMGDVLC